MKIKPLEIVFYRYNYPYQIVKISSENHEHLISKLLFDFMTSLNFMSLSNNTEQIIIKKIYYFTH